MYNQKFVATIVVNGHIVPETEDGVVFLDAGTEYKIRLRNRNDRRAVATITIDGENVTEGGVVIQANGYVEIERSVLKASKFKFVALDSEDAQDFGKDQANRSGNMGFIAVEFRLEKQRKLTNTIDTSGDWMSVGNLNPVVGGAKPSWDTPHNPVVGGPLNRPVGTPRRITTGPVNGMAMMSSAGAQCINTSYSNVSLDCGSQASSAPKSDLSDLGCTVDGGFSTQKFKETYLEVEPIGCSVHLTLKLRDRSKEQAIKAQIELLEKETLAKIEQLKKQLS